LFESLRFSAEAYTAAFTRELPQYDLRGQIAELGVSTLLIVGRSDPYRAHMEWLAMHLPKATLCTLDGVGHFPFVDAAASFRQRIAAFVTRT
jgi:pimeloyl-ACP methyl ester carboxylesterase